MENVLQVTNLSKVFYTAKHNSFTAVSDVSFTLSSGETLGIVGESGSGKSTIAKLITRLMDATQGTVFLEGKDITHLKGKALIPVYEKMQMVFQNPISSFDPRRTLGDGIGECLRNRGIPKEERKERVTALLKQCGLNEEIAERFPHEVSGGQCQRAAIARALANEPRIIILDEATSSLDVTVQRKIMELLTRLQKEKNISYLFICHNLALVQEFCDRIIVMSEGKVAEEGCTEEVLMHPESDAVKKLLDAVFW